MHDLQVIKKMNSPNSRRMTKIVVAEDVFTSKNFIDVDNIEEATNKTHIEDLFCDNSGFGNDHESALSKEQLVDKIQELMIEHSQIYTCIVDEGQFQLYIGVYK